MKDADFVKIAKALADPTRHRMLREVRAAGELTCKQVCERFALSQPTISHHICTLADAGLFNVRKRGQFHVLSVDEELVGEFVACIGAADESDVRLRPESSDTTPAPKRRSPTRKTRTRA